MFTGLIETVGNIRQIGTRGNYTLLTVASNLDIKDMKIGESVACDGACLTVVSFGNDCFRVEASQETIDRTILRKYRLGSSINLERALQLGDRLGGHMVSGHVDDIGRIDHVRQEGDSVVVSVTYDQKYDHLVIEKGSVAISGLSLTINEIRSGGLSVNLIPHTTAATTAGLWKSGQEVNLEFDLVGKYIFRLRQTGRASDLTINKLKECGW